MEFVADNTVNKLILLFVLDKMDIPLTETSILEICTSQNTWVSYMDCKDLLYQLLTAKFIYKPNTTNNESRYNITVAGRECLSQFFTKIPASFFELHIISFGHLTSKLFKYLLNTSIIA